MIISMIGDGSAGRRFGTLLVESGYEVLFGARTAGLIPMRVPLDEAARQCDIAIITIPFQSCYEQLPRIAPFLTDKVVIDATNPTDTSDWSPLLLGEENSGGEEIARLLPASHVVKALNTVFADMANRAILGRPGPRFTGFVAADNRDAATEVMRMLQRMGFDPLYAGPLRVSGTLRPCLI